jgi:hypothetical protein
MCQSQVLVLHLQLNLMHMEFVQKFLGGGSWHRCTRGAGKLLLSGCP